MPHNLKFIPSQTVVGRKQTAKAIRQGKAQRVFLACDAENYVVNEMKDLCSEFHVPVTEIATMKELGKACGIQVGAATAAIRKEAPGKKKETVPIR
ncbi:ribosomal L7Ae/L30e/S12e/Gadd45 family protein [Eubacteriales bacterium mix99]|jgi:large subunit ribosomal protein L7A